jgi:hypothetical protein
LFIFFQALFQVLILYFQRISKEAIIFHEKALVIDLKIYGDQHPAVARDYNNLGLNQDSSFTIIRNFVVFDR